MTRAIRAVVALALLLTAAAAGWVVHRPDPVPACRTGAVGAADWLAPDPAPAVAAARRVAAIWGPGPTAGESAESWHERLRVSATPEFALALDLIAPTSAPGTAPSGRAVVRWIAADSAQVVVPLLSGRSVAVTVVARSGVWLVSDLADLPGVRPLLGLACPWGQQCALPGLPPLGLGTGGPGGSASPRCPAGARPLGPAGPGRRPAASCPLGPAASACRPAGPPAHLAAGAGLGPAGGSGSAAAAARAAPGLSAPPGLAADGWPGPSGRCPGASPAVGAPPHHGGSRCPAGCPGPGGPPCWARWRCWGASGPPRAVARRLDPPGRRVPDPDHCPGSPIGGLRAAGALRRRVEPDRAGLDLLEACARHHRRRARGAGAAPPSGWGLPWHRHPLDR
jgi:hypothetical protein